MKRIYVGNLSFSWGEEEVRGLFAAYGEVYKVDLINDRATGRPRGFDFGGMHTIGNFRIAVTNSPRPVRLPSLPDDLVRILKISAEKRTLDQRHRLMTEYLKGDKDFQQKIRLGGVQDLAWALANSPAFLFNR